MFNSSYYSYEKVLKGSFYTGMKPLSRKLKTIRKLMIDRDVPTNLSLAKRIGTSPRFMGQFLQGQRRSRRREIEVAKILGISPKRFADLIRQ
jgi:hypothetical protein